MPAGGQEATRGRVVHGLFWGGVALAPVAILILLFGSGTGSLRIAVTLAVLTIVLLAVSIAMRPSVEMVRVDIEHRVLDEMERVRLRTRDEISMAARNTHRALADRMHMITAHVEDLRSVVDDVQTGAMIAPASPVDYQAAPGTVRRTETVHVTRRTTTIPSDGDPSSTGTVYGSKAAIEGDWRERGDDRSHDRGHDRGRDRDDRHDRGRDRDRDDRLRDDYRDERPRDDYRDDRYRDDRPRDERPRDDYRDDRYRDERPRDDYRDDRHRDERPRDDYRDDRYRDDRYPEARSSESRYDERREDRWEGGDRWASLRDDERGREVRMGERRSSVRSDGRGTEYRVEDRWAALHHEDGGRESEWDRTRRSDGPRALPPAPGDAPGRYTDDRYDGERDQVRWRGRERMAAQEWEREPDDGRYAPRPRQGHSSEYDR